MHSGSEAVSSFPCAQSCHCSGVLILLEEACHAAILKLSAPIYDVASLLPHSGHMVLIDCVKEFGDDYTVCRAPVGDKHILLQDGVLPSMAYMELMAQGIGAFAGIEALKAGEPVRLGFLLGTRKLDLFADSVPVGTELEVRAHVSIQDLGGMGVFDCELRGAGWL